MIKDKIKTLNDILQEYCKYFKYYNKVKVYNLGLRFFIKFYEPKSDKCFGTFYSRKIPIYELDKFIANYRAKVFNEKNKLKCSLEQKQSITKTNSLKDLLKSFFVYMTSRELNLKKMPKRLI